MSDVFILTQLGGMNDYIAPDMLKEMEYPRGVNLISRGGKITTRPTFRRLGNMPAGRFQGLYELYGTLYGIVGGAIYKSRDAQTWTEVSGLAVSSRCRRTWATIVNNDLMINDGTSPPVVVGQYSNRKLSADADGNPEIPAGTVCVYGQSRIFFADRTRRVLMASDVYMPGEYDSVYGFTEQGFLNESFAIRQPDALGDILAMRFVKSSQTGTGLGQLVVIYQYGVCAYNVYLPRNTWLNEQMGQVLMRTPCAGGQDFTMGVNNDLFFRTDTGLATLKDYASQTESGFRTIPLTMSLSGLLDRDPAWAMEYGSIVVDEDRALFTHGLRVDEYGDYFFDSLVSMDLAAFYSGGETQMTFDGFWTGPKITKVLSASLSGKKLVLAASKGDSNENILWAVDYGGIYDNGNSRPRLRWYTRRLYFDAAMLYKKFLNAEIWLSDLKSDCELTLYFRGDSSLWQTASTGEFEVKYYTSNDVESYPQTRNKVRIPIGEDVCDPITKRMLRSSSGFQFCVQIKGYARVELLRLTAENPVGDGGEELICDLTNEDMELSLTDDTLMLYDYDEEFLV